MNSQNEIEVYKMQIQALEAENTALKASVKLGDTKNQFYEEMLKSLTETLEQLVGVAKSALSET